MDLPLHRVVTTERHEWVISNSDSRPLTAKEFEFQLHSARQQMVNQGFDSQNDDAYYVKTTDENEIILFVEQGDVTMANSLYSEKPAN